MGCLCEQIAGKGIELSPICIGHLWIFLKHTEVMPEGFCKINIIIIFRRIRHKSNVNPSSLEKKALQITGTAFYILGVGLLVTASINIYQGHRPVTTLKIRTAA